MSQTSNSVQIRYLSPIEVEIRFPPETGAGARRISLLGTAHVSEQSAKQTEDKIAELQPDCICIELDRQRYDNLRQRERWQSLDLFKTLKEGKGFLLLVNLLLASFQKRVGRDLAMKPGQEMIRAMELAEQQKVHLELVDRPIEVTLKRAWSACNIWQRMKLLNGLLLSLFSDESISEEDIENLKEANTLEHLMDEFANYLPSIKTSLIDERDVFLARSIAGAPGNNVFAVLGAGHLRGVCRVLERVLAEQGNCEVLVTDYQPEAQAEVQATLDMVEIPQSATVQQEVAPQISPEARLQDSPTKSDSQTAPTGEQAQTKDQAEGRTKDQTKDQLQAPAKEQKHQPEWLKNPHSLVPQTDQLMVLPGKSAVKRFLPWVIPGLAILIMAAGFFFADTEKALHGIGIWALSHSALAGLAALLVLAHPLSILVAVLVSPFTALNPTISVGLVTALTEVLLRKPRVKDVESLLELEKWWQFRQNRIWHVLIIFFVVSLGGAAATFIALPWLSVLFSA